MEELKEANSQNASMKMRISELEGQVLSCHLVHLHVASSSLYQCLASLNVCARLDDSSPQQLFMFNMKHETIARQQLVLHAFVNLRQRLYQSVCAWRAGG